MATAAKKLKKAQDEATQTNVARLPVTTVKLGKETFPAPASLGELVQKGKDIKDMMDELKADLEAINAQILAEVPRWMEGTGTLHIIVDKVDCTVTLRDGVTIGDVDQLRTVLGNRFDDLVKAKVSYAPEAKLVAMATDGDEPLQRDIAGCLKIQEAKATVSYKGL